MTTQNSPAVKPKAVRRGCLIGCLTLFAVFIGVLVLAWLVFPIAFPALINSTSMRLRNDGYSMEPALPNGSYIIADTKAYQQRAPQRGDIVAFHLQDSPSSNPTQLFVKRVIGLPGEIVTIDQGQVSIDGVPLNETYIINPGSYNGEWHMAKEQYFVLGDNRGDSKDSHNWGGLPRENILAKVIWIYWPLDNFGEIPDVSSEY